MEHHVQRHVACELRNDSSRDGDVLVEEGWYNSKARKRLPFLVMFCNKVFRFCNGVMYKPFLNTSFLLNITVTVVQL